MVGRLEGVCTRGVGKEAMGEGEDNGDEDNENEMVVDEGQGGMRWAISGWASEARGEGEDGGGGKGAQ